MLPRDTAGMLAIARRRDARMIGRSRLAIDTNRPSIVTLTTMSRSARHSTPVNSREKLGIAVGAEPAMAAVMVA